MLSRLAPRLTRPAVQLVLGLFWGRSDKSVVLITISLLVLGCKWIGAIPVCPLCACPHMSCGDLDCLPS
jgi:hypothetical protein